MCGLRHLTPMHDDNYQLRQNNTSNVIPPKSVSKVANDNARVFSSNVHVTSHCLYSDDHFDGRPFPLDNWSCGDLQ